MCLSHYGIIAIFKISKLHPVKILGVEERGRYYENSGALRDMVQNHLMQMVALLAMEPPIALTPKEIRSEKVRALRSLRPLTKEDVHTNFVRGQYGAGSSQWYKCFLVIVKKQM